ncbi:MAG: replicative DNA helicase [Cyanobacteria bacterium J06607_13]
MQSRDFDSTPALDNVTPLTPALPPNALEAEDELLSSILFGGADALESVLDTTRPEHFLLSQNQVLYQAMLDLYEDDQSVDLLTLQYLLDERNHLKRAGGKSRLAALSQSAFTASGAGSAAALVKRAFLKRQMQRVGHVLTQAATSGADLEQVIDNAENEVLELGELLRGDGGIDRDVPVMTALAYRALDEAERLRDDRRQADQSGEALIGFSTGINEFDLMTGGLQRQDLVFFAGRPSMGKSIAGENVAYNVACQGYTVAFISYEQPAIDLARRRMSAETGLSFRRIKAGDLSDDYLTLLTEGVSQIQGMNFYIDDQCGETIAALTARLKKIKKLAGGHLDLVVIDYLQLMEGQTGNRVADLSKITRQLKKLARKLDICIVCLSQLSRSCEARNDKRPINSDLRESGSLEQDGDMIVMFYRDEYYNEETAEPGIAEWIITKQRNGPLCKVKTVFQGHRFRFGNLDDPELQPPPQPETQSYEQAELQTG